MEVFRGNRFEGRELVNAGVIHQNVQLSIRSLGLGEEARDVPRFGDVGLDGDGLAAFLSDARDHGIGAGLAGGVIDNDRRAFRSEMLSDRSADSF